MSLDELGRLHQTDKWNHGYLVHYENVFRDIRDGVTSMLEIGVYHGRSLRMWRDYFSMATIYGVDWKKRYIISEERIKCFQGDQEDRAFLAEVLHAIERPQIVIDDGGHKAAQHVASFVAIWPVLESGGWYCIEDTCTLFDPNWTDPEALTIVDLIYGRRRRMFTGHDDIQEVRFINDGHEDSLIMLRKRND